MSEPVVIFLVCQVEWEIHAVLSAWTTREAAAAEAERLSAQGEKFEVEAVTLNVPWSDT